MSGREGSVSPSPTDQIRPRVRSIRRTIGPESSASKNLSNQTMIQFPEQALLTEMKTETEANTESMIDETAREFNETTDDIQASSGDSDESDGTDEENLSEEQARSTNQELGNIQIESSETSDNKSHETKEKVPDRVASITSTTNVIITSPPRTNKERGSTSSTGTMPFDFSYLDLSKEQSQSIYNQLSSLSSSRRASFSDENEVTSPLSPPSHNSTFAQTLNLKKLSLGSLPIPGSGIPTLSSKSSAASSDSQLLSRKSLLMKLNQPPQPKTIFNNYLTNWFGYQTKNSQTPVTTKPIMPKPLSPEILRRLSTGSIGCADLALRIQKAQLKFDQSTMITPRSSPRSPSKIASKVGNTFPKNVTKSKSNQNQQKKQQPQDQSADTPIEKNESKKEQNSGSGGNSGIDGGVSETSSNQDVSKKSLSNIGSGGRLASHEGKRKRSSLGNEEKINVIIEKKSSRDHSRHRNGSGSHKSRKHKKHKHKHRLRSLDGSKSSTEQSDLSTSLSSPSSSIPASPSLSSSSIPGSSQLESPIASANQIKAAQGKTSAEIAKAVAEGKMSDKEIEEAIARSFQQSLKARLFKNSKLDKKLFISDDESKSDPISLGVANSMTGSFEDSSAPTIPKYIKGPPVADLRISKSREVEQKPTSPDVNSDKKSIEELRTKLPLPPDSAPDSSKNVTPTVEQAQQNMQLEQNKDIPMTPRRKTRQSRRTRRPRKTRKTRRTRRTPRSGRGRRKSSSRRFSIASQTSLRDRSPYYLRSRSRRSLSRTKSKGSVKSLKSRKSQQSITRKSRQNRKSRSLPRSQSDSSIEVAMSTHQNAKSPARGRTSKLSKSESVIRRSNSLSNLSDDDAAGLVEELLRTLERRDNLRVKSLTDLTSGQSKSRKRLRASSRRPGIVCQGPHQHRVRLMDRSFDGELLDKLFKEKGLPDLATFERVASTRSGSISSHGSLILRVSSKESIQEPRSKTVPRSRRTRGRRKTGPKTRTRRTRRKSVGTETDLPESLEKSSRRRSSQFYKDRSASISKSRPRVRREDIQVDRGSQTDLVSKSLGRRKSTKCFRTNSIESHSCGKCGKDIIEIKPDSRHGSRRSSRSR